MTFCYLEPHNTEVKMNYIKSEAMDSSVVIVARGRE